MTDPGSSERTAANTRWASVLHAAMHPAVTPETRDLALQYDGRCYVCLCSAASVVLKRLESFSIITAAQVPRMRTFHEHWQNRQQQQRHSAQRAAAIHAQSLDARDCSQGMLISAVIDLQLDNCAKQ